MESKPRIILIDGHCVDFLMRNMYRIMSKNKIVGCKHKFLLDYFIENGFEVCNLVTEKGSTATYPLTAFRKFKAYRFWESKYIKRVNNLSEIKDFYDISEIRSSDIIITYLIYPYQLDLIRNITCYKLCFGNHFISTAKKVSLSECGINGFVNEIDLSQNDFVVANFDIKTVTSLLLPYSYAERFKSIIPFDDRKNKCLAIGTSSTCKGQSGYTLFRDYFQTEFIQPMRQFIFEHKNELKETIDSYISYILEDAKRQPQNKYLKKFEAILGRSGSRQSSYTSFNMVDKFNEYKMFVCPEEIQGMPGIGFVEGMACGLAYIGLDHYMYKCLGLVPGYHYITYDGTIEDLQRVIRYYMSNNEELKIIALRGSEYVRDNFSGSSNSKKFISSLLMDYQGYINK